jgi:pyruvate/2-oxoglutarate dehydrogenase complex dihydrolipoamide acyltransferase (E2) component
MESKEPVMRRLASLLVFLVLGGVSLGAAGAQPAGSAAPAAPPAAAPPAAAPAPAPAPAAPAPSIGATAPAELAAMLRKTCVDAMNADETFARAIIQKAIDTDRVSVQSICADVDTARTHQEAVAHVEKNQRHVIGAYAAMWVIAALFLLYLLQRQQRLKAEIAQLRHDLDAAAKDGKDAR